MQIDKITPTRIIRPFGKKSPVEIRLFGRNGGKTDWSIATLNEENLKRQTIGSGMGAFARMYDIAAWAKVSIIYAPHPAFDASFCDCGLLQTQFSSNDDAMMEADFHDNWSWVLCRGVQADACDVPKGSSFWLSSADCPTLIVTDGEKVVCAHCGYKSLVDQQALVGKPSRHHFSVVDTVIAEFADRSRQVNLRAFVTLGIGPHWSEASETELKALTRHERLVNKNPWENYHVGYERLDIVELVRCQCLNRGIGNVRADDNDTFTNKDEYGKFLWWSHERAMKKSPADKLKRNGVLVIHR